MLRKLNMSDALSMLECMSDSNVISLMKIDGNKLTIKDCEEFIKNSLESKSDKHFAIANDKDEWVGTISLKNIDLTVKSAEYAIITSSKIHGSGIALNATKELLNYGFNELGLERIYLNVVKDNIRANRFYIKCGFKYEGCFRKSIYVKGSIYDLNWYSILKSDFMEDNSNV